MIRPTAMRLFGVRRHAHAYRGHDSVSNMLAVSLCSLSKHGAPKSVAPRVISSASSRLLVCGEQKQYTRGADRPHWPIIRLLLEDRLMSGASQGATCVVCGQLLAAGREDCPSCGASGAWRQVIQAAAFAQSRFVQWANDRLLAGGPAEAIAQDFSRQREEMARLARQGGPLPSAAAAIFAATCWSCRAPVSAAGRHCAACGAGGGNLAVLDLYVCSDQGPL